MSPDDPVATPRTIAFLNWAHALDHYFVLILSPAIEMKVTSGAFGVEKAA